MTYTRSAHTAWRRLGEETIVINLATRRMVSLNAGGSAIWERLESPADLPALAASLAPGAETAAMPTTADFIATLAHEGLVEPAMTGSSIEPAASGAELPAGFVPPRITWNEELLRFGGACGKTPGGGGPCLGGPASS